MSDTFPYVNNADTPSPCINICDLNAGDICIGCGRSLNEIAEWSVASNQQKQKICDLAAQRRKQMEEHGKHPAQ